MKSKKPTKTIDQNILNSKPWILEDVKTLALKDKIESIGIPLKDWQDVKVWYGIKTGYNEAFIINTNKKDEILSRCFDNNERKRTIEIIKPILRGRDIKRYKSKWNDLWLIFIPWHFPLHKENETGASEKAEKLFERDYHALYNHLLAYKSRLLKRNSAETGIRYEWYALQRCANSYYDEIEKDKIVFPQIMAGGAYFSFDSDKYYLIVPAIMMVGSHLHYILSLLTSKSCYFFLRIFYMGGGIEGELTVNRLEQLPIPRLNLNIPSEKETYDRLCELSLEMMELHKIDTKDENVTDRIYEVDGEINRIIYKLYKLTDDEIEIIEDRY